MLGGTAEESGKYYHLSNNPLILWSAKLFGLSMGIKALAVAVAGICAGLLFAVRRSGNLLGGYSICAVLAMYWSYSRHYDLVLLAIPLTYLLTQISPRARLVAAAYVLLGLLLWSPIRIETSRQPIVMLLTAVTSIIVLSAIVASERKADVLDLGVSLAGRGVPSAI